MNKVFLKDYAYVRAGIHATQNWIEINEKIGRGGLVLKSSPDESLNRRILLKFDLSDVELDESKRIVLRFPVKGGVTVHFDIYEAGNDWDGKTVTWNDVAKKDLVAENVTSVGLSKIVLTDYINSQIKKGVKDITFLIVRRETVDNESSVSVSDDLSQMPYLLFEENTGSSYVKNLCGDKAENDAIWAKAEEEYKKWKEMECILEAKAEPDILPIKTPSEQFGKITKHKAQSNAPVFFESKTRTLSDLKDIDQYTDGKAIAYDKFGGMMVEELRQEATGFFYSKKLNGRWWLIDPMGYPYFILGLDVLQYSFARSEIQKQSMLEKYGSAEKWAEYTTRHLTEDLRFTAASRAAAEMGQVENPMPVQQFLSFMSSYGRKYHINNSISGSTTFSENNTMPVFNPSFEKYADEYAKEHLAAADNPYIIGYSLDNELPMDGIMLDNYLTIDPGKAVNYYSYAAAWTWLKNETGKESPTGDDITDELRDKFRGFIWNKYFSVTTEAFRRYDSNHMIIGTRFLTVAASSKWVMKVAGHYLDAITINWYFHWTPDANTLEYMSKNADKPFIVTEFYAKAGDAEGNLANRSGAGFYVETQQDRADYYHNFTLRMLECRNMVGWYWLQYIDNDPNNGIGDLSSRDSNKGIVSNTHNEYTVLTSAMAEINKNIYKITQYFDNKYSQ